MAKRIMDFAKKWWWLILAVIAVLVFLDTILKILSWVLVATLVGGLVYWVLKIPGFKPWLRSKWARIKKSPAKVALAFGIALVIVLGIMFVPGWIASSQKTTSTQPGPDTNQQQGTTQQPGNNQQPGTTQQPGTGSASTTQPQQTEDQPKVEVLTPDSFSNFVISFVPSGSTDGFEITAFVDARTADPNVQEVPFPEGYQGNNCGGMIVYDFLGSDKEIKSITIIRLDMDSNYQSSFRYDYDANNQARFPYPDYFQADNSDLYVSHATRFTFSIEFTDGSLFKGVFTLRGKFS